MPSRASNPVGNQRIVIAQTPTITAGAYSAGDAVGGKLTFSDASSPGTNSGRVTGVTIIDDAGQDAATELWLFDQNFTPIADNAAAAFSEADLENLVGIIAIAAADYKASGTPSAAYVESKLDFQLPDGTPTTASPLYGQLVTRGTPTYAATDDITVKIHVVKD